MDTELIKYYVRGPEKLTEMADTYILVHGNRSSAIYWDQVVENLHQRRPGVRTVTLDLRGYGQSNHLTAATKIEDFADDVHKVVLAIAEKEGRPHEMIAARFIIVGWSFGGMIVMTMASRYPDFYSRLVLVASGPIDGMRFGDVSNKEEFLNLPYIKQAQDALEAKDINFFHNLASDKWFFEDKRPEPTHLNQLLQECLLQKNFSDVCWMIHNFNKIKEAQSNFRKDTMILVYHCKDDKVVPYSAAEKIREVLGARVKLISVEHVGHMIPLIIPEKLSQDMIRFFDLE